MGEIVLKLIKIRRREIVDSIRFDVKITEEDLYKYNLHHAYSSSQGIFSVVLFALLIVLWILRFPTMSNAYRVMYPLFAFIILIYIPMSLKLRAKNAINQAVFQHPLTYELKDDGIFISSPTTEEPAELPWEYVYKVSVWKGYLLIYSNRINAYIIPVESIESQYDSIVSFIKSHVEDYKLQIK